MQSFVSVSSLVTRFDYADFKAAAAKSEMKKIEKDIVKIIGTALIFSSFVLWGLNHYSITRNIIYGVMAAAGIILGCFYEMIIQYSVRRRALNYYDNHKERFIAQTVEFFEDKITFKTERYSAAVPYEKIYKAFEDGRVFIIYTSINEMKFVTKRALSNNDCEKIRKVFQSKLQQKYQQEGAR